MSVHHEIRRQIRLAGKRLRHYSVVAGRVPVAKLQGYHREKRSPRTQRAGGRLAVEADGYEECHDEEVIAAFGDDADRDVANTADSNIGARGRVLSSRWDEVPAPQATSISNSGSTTNPRKSSRTAPNVFIRRRRERQGARPRDVSSAPTARAGFRHAPRPQKRSRRKTRQARRSLEDARRETTAVQLFRERISSRRRVQHNLRVGRAERNREEEPRPRETPSHRPRSELSGLPRL